jgi:hypothetical protein
MADHRLTVTLALSLTLFALTFAGLSAQANQELTHSADPAALVWSGLSE